jgi:hypothetical protein
MTKQFTNFLILFLTKIIDFSCIFSPQCFQILPLDPYSVYNVSLNAVTVGNGTAVNRINRTGESSKFYHTMYFFPKCDFALINDCFPQGEMRTEKNAT